MSPGPPAAGPGTDGLLAKLREDSVQALSTQFEWSQATASFVTPRATIRTVLQSLINHGYWFDAATLLAHAMPQREAAWWATRVCQEYLDENGIEGPERAEQEAVLAVCREWVVDPLEEARMATYRAAMAIPNRVPAHWAGMAVFWATGNITPDSGVITPPPPYLYARGVSAAIDLAANLTFHARDEAYGDALGRGVDIASGGDGEKTLRL
jgi:hypothetical protein